MAKKGLFFKSSFHIHFTFLLNSQFFHRANDVHQFSIIYNFVKKEKQQQQQLNMIMTPLGSIYCAHKANCKSDMLSFEETLH